MTIQPPSQGFLDPVHDAQAVFRAVMNALARPGTIMNLDLRLLSPLPLTPELAAVALALCDHETPVWLDAELSRSPEAAAFLRFHCGMQLVENPADSAFALAVGIDGLPPLAEFAQGTDEYPDRSTTIVAAAATLTEGVAMGLAGPGIQHALATLHVAPLPAGFVDQLGENRSRFPRGVDCLFVADGKVVGLPRTTTLVEV